MMKYMTDDERVGMGCFARVQLGKSMVVEYYIGALMLQILCWDWDFYWSFVERVLSVSVKYTVFEIY